VVHFSCELVVHFSLTLTKNLWDLFEEPALAQNLMSNDYQLVDLQAMSDNEITKKHYLGMMEYFMKHIHMRDALQLWRNFMSSFKADISIYVESEEEAFFLLLGNLLWYTDSKVPASQKSELAGILSNNLSEHGDHVMRTIADSYIEEGMQKGVQQGIQQGVQQTTHSIATNMLKNGMDVLLISDITDLSIKQIKQLKKDLS
jgi:predicted transposase/invertase (TIGR01784 family)